MITHEAFTDLSAKFSATAVEYAQAPDSQTALNGVLEARRAIAQHIAGIAKLEWDDTWIARFQSILDALAKSGLWDLGVDEQDLAYAATLGSKSGPMLAAHMILIPAWQWAEAPRIDEVPMAMWGAYASYIFYSPTSFTELGHAESYGHQALRWLEQLWRLAESNRGSAAVRAAMLAYIENNSCIPLYFSEINLRRHYELRGRILSTIHNIGPQVSPLAMPRAGRRLKIGFLNRHFAPQTETYTTLPSLEHLDPERFDLRLFAIHRTDTPLENYAASKANGITFLGKDIEQQLNILRGESLDVLIFGTNLTASFHELTRLALYRIAPLQVVNNSSCTTTGMAEIDLYVSGTFAEVESAPEQYTERLGLLPGPAHAFNYEADTPAASTTWTRAALGIPDEAVVFVSAANFYKVLPEMRHTWAKILASVPNSRLLIHPFNPNWSSEYPIKRFCAEFDHVLTAYGVATDRLIVSSNKFPSRADVKELLSIGDIYLDTYPFGGVNSLVDPLEVGIPPIVWEGDAFRARMGSALLRSVNLDELVATSEKAYRALAVRLATDSVSRASLKTRIADAMARTPIFLDQLAASDAFGSLIETAYDELEMVGSTQFRAACVPIQAPRPANPSSLVKTGMAQLESGDLTGATSAALNVLGAYPSHPEARQLLGSILLHANQPSRAATYLLSAVQQVDGDARLWLNLAIALHRSGQTQQALQALETCLRIDGGLVDGWICLADIARQAGNSDLAQQASDVIRQLAPDNPQSPILGKAPMAEARHPSEIQAAESCYRAQDWVGAESHARQALERKQHDAAAHHLLGLALWRQQKNADAIGALNKAVQLDQNNPEYSQSLGVILMQYSAYNKAVPLLENVLRLQQNDANTWALMGEAKLQTKDILGAEKALTKALSLTPAHTHALMWLGHVRKRQGRLSEAMELHRRSVQALPTPETRTRKPRVIFVVQHGPMWTSLESVYQAFAQDSTWETVIVAVPYLGTWDESEKQRSLAVLDFLQEEGLPFVRWDEFKLEPGCADLIFLPKPHDHTRPQEWQAPNLLRYIPRLAYVPYGLEIGGGDMNAHVQWNMPLQQLAWAVFARSERQKRLYHEHCVVGNHHIIVTGHPKMDAIRNLESKRDPELEAWCAGRKMVLWNAQYDVRPDGTPFGAGYSTFTRWWQFIPEEFARRPKLALVLRPHPIFFSILKMRQVLTDKDLEDFFSRCKAAGNIQIDRRTSYLPAFASSAAMISDASSFLLEYAGTGRPLLYLRNPRGPGLNQDGDFVTKHCYTGETEEQIRHFLDLLEAGNDPGACDRRANYAEFMHRPAEGVGFAIKHSIEDKLRQEHILT